MRYKPWTLARRMMGQTLQSDHFEPTLTTLKSLKCPRAHYTRILRNRIKVWGTSTTSNRSVSTQNRQILMFDPPFDALRSVLYSARQIVVVQRVHDNVKQFLWIKHQIRSINLALMAVHNHESSATKIFLKKMLGNENKNFWDMTFS